MLWCDIIFERDCDRYAMKREVAADSMGFLLNSNGV